MMEEQLRQSISDCSVDIRNKYKEISPLLYFAKWMDDEANVVSVGNPVFGIIEEGNEALEADIAADTKRLKAVTVGSKCAVSKSLLKKSDKFRDAITRAFAISTKEAIENILFYGDPSDSTIPTITSTGTIKIADVGINTSLRILTEMYKEFDPANLSGAIWMVSKEIRDIILDSKTSDTGIDFFGNLENKKLHYMGLPVFVTDNFSNEKGIVAALVNPLDVTMRCTLFDDEQGLIELTDISNTNNTEIFLSIFDVCGVVDKPDSAIVLKVETAPVAPTTTRTTNKTPKKK